MRNFGRQVGVAAAIDHHVILRRAVSALERIEDIADVPQAILDVASDGDVVITMGAGSIGGVPGKLANGR